MSNDRQFADLGTVAHQVLAMCLDLTYNFGVSTPASTYEGTVLSVEDEPHARLSPSSAERWSMCPAAAGMESRFPEEPLPPRSYAFEDDYVQAVQTCLDYVDQRYQSLKENGPVTVRIETRVSPTRYLFTTECDGTVDIALVTDGYVEIIDFKAGRGVLVETGSPQLDLYLLGLCAEYTDAEGRLPFRRARATICQPRYPGIEPIRWVDIDNVDSWVAQQAPRFREAAEATREPEPPFRPAEKTCQWCKAKGACAAYQRFALFSAGVLDPFEMEKASTDSDAAFDELDTLATHFAARDTHVLSGKRLRQILDYRSLLEGALKAAEAWALELMKTGKAPEEVQVGYKLVHGRSVRKWAMDEAETEKRLKRIKVKDPETGKTRGLGKKDLMETRLKSAPNIEKMLSDFDIPRKDARWDAFQALVNKPEGALTLAPRSDARPEVRPTRADPDTAFSGEIPKAPTPET